MPEKGKQQKDHEAPVPTKKSGKVVFINGDVYDGDYETNQSESIYRHGNGTFNCKNGVIYTGEWHLDKMNGRGEYIHPSGMTYKGDFVDGKFEGVGVYKWPDGSVYEGEFKNSKLEGHGVYHDTSGQIWSGKFRGNAAPGLRFNINM